MRTFFQKWLDNDTKLTAIFAAVSATGEVVLIMQICSLLEDYTSGKAQKGIEKLAGLTPQMPKKRVQIPRFK